MTDLTTKTQLADAGYNRRSFLKSTMVATSALAIGAPTILRARNLNDKLNLAIIGTGGRGGSNMRSVESENIVAVHMSGDSMIQSDPKSGQEVQFVRAQAAMVDTLPIVGTWSFTHSTGGTAFQIFTADGNMHLRVPFRTDRGTYMLSGDTLTIVIEGQDAWQVRYTIDGAKLTLFPGDGSPQQYNRVPW